MELSNRLEASKRLKYLNAMQLAQITTTIQTNTRKHVTGIKNHQQQINFRDKSTHNGTPP